MQRFGDVGRNPRRREGSNPLRRANPGKADLGERRHVRIGSEPLRGGDRERAHAPRLHHSDRIGDVEPGNVDVAIAEIADDLRAAALERDVDERDAGTLRQNLGVDLLIAADAGAAETHPARMSLGIGDEVGEGLRRRSVGREVRGGGEKEHRHVRERRDDLQVALVVDLQFLGEQDRRQPIGRDIADHQGVAVRPGARGLLDRDDAGGPRLVFHEHAATESLPQLLGVEARDDVGQPAGRVGHDDADRLRREGGLRPGGGRDAEEA